MAYTPPSTAKPYTLSIPDTSLNILRQLLQLTPLGPKTYENTQTTHNYGVTHEWLSSARDHWLNTYSWRDQEKHINSFPNYTSKIEDIDVHYIALFSQKKDAVPIIFMHGWPGSFIEFLPMLEVIKKKYEKAEDMPYHIIVPSLPGYTLSSGPPVDRDWVLADTARVMNELMKSLGFDRYIAQGGDVGSFTSSILSLTYDECVGAHLNLFRLDESEFPDPSTMTDYERKAAEHASEWKQKGMAYAIEHATRPSTIGHVLSTNPVALLAWIGEKFLEWSDPATTPDLTTILTNVSLYWLTSSFPRSIYPYRGFGKELTPYMAKPTGFSMFPYELIPGLKSPIEKRANLVSYAQHEKGGHFAALEQPAVLWGDVEEFAGRVWKAEENGGKGKL